MKKLMAVTLLAVLGCGAGACSSLTANLVQRSAKPDQSVVESFVRMNDVQGAREYLIRFGIAETEVMARIQKARDQVAQATAGK